MIFGICVGNTVDTYPAIRAYGAVSAFSTRLDMIRAASEAYFLHRKKTVSEEFQSILDDAKNFATRRNEIAHGIVQPYFIGHIVVGSVLGPSRYATRKLKLERDDNSDKLEVVRKYAYTSTEIDYFGEQFKKLADRIIRIWPEVHNAGS